MEVLYAEVTVRVQFRVRARVSHRAEQLGALEVLHAEGGLGGQLEVRQRDDDALVGAEPPRLGWGEGWGRAGCLWEGAGGQGRVRVGVARAG